MGNKELLNDVFYRTAEYSQAVVMKAKTSHVEVVALAVTNAHLKRRRSGI